MHYAAYQLSIASEIPLPELALGSAFPDAQPDVSIRLGSLPQEGPCDGEQLGPYVWANRDSLWLHVPGVARFQVRSGDTVLVDPEPSTDEDSVRVFLLGSVLGALLYQRGYLVLHGNAIRIGDHCMVCVGQTGAGKSTLAAAFMQRGYTILADDITAVDQHGCAVSGLARIKLWRDAAEKLKVDTAKLRRVRPQLEKFSCPLGGRTADEPVPIRWVYILCSDNRGDFRLDSIHGMRRFMPLQGNTYRARFLQGMGLKPRHLQLCGRLAGQIRLVRVIRPRDGFQLDTLVERLLSDMAAHP